MKFFKLNLDRILSILVILFILPISCSDFISLNSMILDKNVNYRLDVIKVKNLSRNHIRINSGKNSKTILYNDHIVDYRLNIPFISINNYLVEYVDEQPFIPHRALKIETKLGVFGLWENEQGVMCSPDSKSYSRNRISLKCLMKGFNAKNLNAKIKKIIPLILSVDEKGRVKISLFHA